jgi:FSR family fosmidomycin resistance protein-like MFS transporter
VPKTTSREPCKSILPFFLGHLVNDSYISFLAPLLPLLIQRLGLSLTMAGFLATLLASTSSFLQPVFGHFIDRAKRPLPIIAGPLLTVCTMALIGTTGSYWQLIILLILAGIGTSLFHPIGATSTALSGLKNRGLTMAVFSLAGGLGEAIGPLVVVAYVGAFGITRTPWLVLPALVLLAWIAFAAIRHRPVQAIRTESRSLSLRSLPPMLLLLWSAVVLRSVTDAAFYSFLAVLITNRGASALAGGAGISVFLLAGAIGGLIGGRLADKLGAKWVIFSGVTLATPFFLLFLHGPAPFSFLFIGAAGLFTFATLPVGIVAGQQLLPKQMGFVSGLVMGLPWGIAGLALTPIGWLADLFGLSPIMTGVAFLPLVSAALVLFYRENSTS